MKAKTPRIGRPPLPKDKAKGTLLSVRFSESERATLDEAAERKGVVLSKWARDVLLAKAAKES